MNDSATNDSPTNAGTGTTGGTVSASLIADDHQVVRSGLEQLLATTSDIVLVGMAANGREAIDVVAAERPEWC